MARIVPSRRNLRCLCARCVGANNGSCASIVMLITLLAEVVGIVRVIFQQQLDRTVLFLLPEKCAFKT